MLVGRSPARYPGPTGRLRGSGPDARPGGTPLIEPTEITLGLEACLAEPPSLLRRARFALLTNQAAVDRRFRPAFELLARAFPGRLAALFGPQHGLWSTHQDNMIETPHGRDSRLAVPVHSLYSETRRPTDEMLDGLDALVVDLPDVGVRVYTYVWTLLHCIEACARRSMPVLVLDRPNPLGGVVVEGPRLEPAFRSFVGRASVPMRHALTMGELARWLGGRTRPEADVRVVPVEGWSREDLLPATGRAWVPPSPNLPRFEGALLYPGMVLVEGTTLSEGRGTTTPFEIAGAPSIDAWMLRDAMEEWPVEGVAVRPVVFRPTFQKWEERDCQGVFLHATDPDRLRSWRLALILLDRVRRLWPDGYRWLQPPYEYEAERMPIDILSGSSAVREAIDQGLDAERLDRLCDVDEASWWRDVGASLLYPRPDPGEVAPTNTR